MESNAARTDAVEAPESSESSPVRRLLVIGCSGHAKVVVDVLERQGAYEVFGFLDSYKPLGLSLSGYQVLGRCEDLPSLLSDGSIQGGIVAIGDNWQRSRIVRLLMELAPGFPFVSAVHPSAQIGAGVAIGRGTAVMAGAVINPGCKIGEFCIVNTRATLDHDSVMEDYSSLAPGVTTGGGVRIGAFSAIAIGAVLIHEVQIGEHTVIGAGATVVKSIPGQVVAYGTPARVVRRRSPGDPYLGVWARD